MKKIFSFAAICVLLVSCGGKNNPVAVVDFPLAQQAGTVDFVIADMPVVPDTESENDLKVNSICHNGNGSYTAQVDVIARAPRSLRMAPVKTVGGSFKFENGAYVYTSGALKNGILKLKEGNLFEFVFNLETTTGMVTDFTPSTTPSDPVAVALCGARWKLSLIQGQVTGKSVKFKFDDQSGTNPNDVEGVAKAINDLAGSQVVDPNNENIKGMYIKAISLNLDPDTVIVEFENGKTREGTWDANLKDKSFEYHLTKADGSLFEADAIGTFDLVDNNTTLVISFNAKNKEGSVDITVKAKKIQ